mgnify:CR=1 FL=1
MKKLTKSQIELREKCMKESESYFNKEWNKPGFAKEMDAFRQEYQMNVAMYKAKKESGLTQTEIARRMGIPRPNVSRIEHSRTVSFDTFCSYLKACGFAFTFALMPSS